MLLAEVFDLFDFAGQLSGDDFFQILKNKFSFGFCAQSINSLSRFFVYYMMSEM